MFMLYVMVGRLEVLTCLAFLALGFNSKSCCFSTLKSILTQLLSLRSLYAVRLG